MRTRKVGGSFCQWSIALISLALAMETASAQLVNGGFETGAGLYTNTADSSQVSTAAIGWTQFNYSSRVSTNTTGAPITAHSGYSLRSYGPFGANCCDASGAYEVISNGVVAGQTWVLDGFALNWSGDPMTNLVASAIAFGVIQIQFRNAGGYAIWDYDGPHLFSVNSTTNPTPLNTWINCSVTATAPSGTTAVAVYAMHVGDDKSGGSIFWDDLSLTQIPEPWTMSLALAGLLGIAVLCRSRDR